LDHSGSTHRRVRLDLRTPEHYTEVLVHTGGIGSRPVAQRSRGMPDPSVIAYARCWWVIRR